MIKFRTACLAAATAVSLTLAPGANAAGTIAQAVLSSITVTGTSVAMLNFSTTSTTPPACAVFPQIRMALDISTNKGKAALSIATAALLAKRKVTVIGTGTCTIAGGVENADSVLVFQ